MFKYSHPLNMSGKEYFEFLLDWTRILQGFNLNIAKR